MKKILFVLALLANIFIVQAQESIFLPIILKGKTMAIDPKIIITDGTIEVDLLEGGWKLAEPYWNPQISQYKGGGTHVNAQLAEGQRLVHREYDNVIETIPLSLRGLDQAQAMKTANEVLALLRQAGDYWTQPYEYDQVWIEVKLPCNACLTGYSRIIRGSIPELTNPFGQPFFSASNQSVMEGISIIIEREPFWQITKPGEIIGPLYNLIDNPDFELWNNGTADSQPDSWTDIETTHIAGKNGRDLVLPKFGQSSLEIRVSGSTLAGAAKGITQVINDIEGFTEYTVIAWVRSEGVSNGIGRILITYASQLELYRDNAMHGWTLYTGKITTSANDTIAIHCEILTTAANTDGTIYIDGLMFIKGDWEQEAKDNILPYLSGSHIVNHWDREPGDINWVDVWNVPGNIDASVGLVFISQADEGVKYGKIHIGQKRSNDIFQLDNFNDIIGNTNDVLSSNDDNLTITPANQYQLADIKILSGIELVQNNSSRYRVLLRLNDNKASGSSTLLARLVYGNGYNINKTLDEVAPEIIDDWGLIDLTPTRTLTWGGKPRNLGQAGYQLEVKRTSGSEEVNLDYILLMPTDGGYLEIDNAKLVNGMAIIVDATRRGETKTGFVNSGFSRLYDGSVPGNWVNHEIRLTVFKNDVWIQRNKGFFRFSNLDRTVTEFTLPVASGGFNNVSGIGVYNNQLYTVYSAGNVMNLYTSVDGNSWSVVASDTIVGSTTIRGPQNFFVYKGKLFFSVSGSFINQGFTYNWDGTTLLRQPLHVDGKFSNFPPTNLLMYDGKLTFVGATVIYQYNDSTGLFEQIDTGPASIPSGFTWIEIFNNELYLTANQVIYKWTGEFIELFNNGAFGGLYSPEVYNNGLYIGAITSVFGEAILYTCDGVNFDTLAVPTNPQRIEHILNHNGILYIAAHVNAQAFTLFSFSGSTECGESNPGEVFGIHSDFKGTPFYSQPRKSNTDHKRHRYIFSYNRDDFTNSIDDKALIGIGFVPRYLELPMKEN